MPRLLTVADYMTESPHSIGVDQTLSDAAKLMRKHGVRHLPVLEGGVLRGILSERDVAIVESLDTVDPGTMRVDEAMSIEPYTVSDRAPLWRVAKAMAAHKYGCAVIMDGLHVKGILTTTDAMRALVDVLAERALPEDTMAPDQVRSVVLSEHAHLRSLLDVTEAAAQRILKGGGFEERTVDVLREQARHLFTAMSAHIELENRVLVPAIRKVDAFGSVHADRMLEEHADQQRTLKGILMQLDDASQPSAAVAAAVARLVQQLRCDMDAEEDALVNSDLLRDDMIPRELEAG
jgi:acetoin utilization protein AcuB